jgi:3-oxoacyl-(acyl-carrier-protein) synthase
MSKVYVTGLGIISAIGRNYEENLFHLRQSKTGIGKATHFTSKYTESHQFGEVPYSTRELINNLNITDTKGLSRTDVLAFTAFLEAINHGGIGIDELRHPETAFISASTVGGMCAHNDLLNDVTMPDKPSDSLHSYSNSAHTFRIAGHYNMKGLTNTINTACSSSANAIILGVNLIRSGRAKRVIAGGADSLSKFTVNGFNALRILSEEPCKPFDEERKGLTLGEGAAYLVLEDESLATGKRKLATVTGFANASDAFHQSSLSEEGTGVMSVMINALKVAGINTDQIGYINTHGTGTDNNDRVELLGMKTVFGKIPPYNSTKSYTGHTLGAAGAVEAVFSIMSMDNSELYKSLHCLTPIDRMAPVSSYTQHIKINHILTNSFGFGGNCTSVVLSKA